MVVLPERSMLLRYLQRSREAVVWKLDGVSEYDIRRPMTATGTNLLGLVKHLACCEFGYLGEPFGRPHGEMLPGWGDGAVNADMWVPADESRADVIDFYRRSWAHADATIDALPLDTVAVIRWWPQDRQEATLERIVVHLIDETARHAGHADIVRELIDGAAGHNTVSTNLPGDDGQWWAAYVDRVEQAARAVRDA